MTRTAGPAARTTRSSAPTRTCSASAAAPTSPRPASGPTRRDPITTTRTARIRAPGGELEKWVSESSVSARSPGPGSSPCAGMGGSCDGPRSRPACWTGHNMARSLRVRLTTDGLAARDGEGLDCVLLKFIRSLYVRWEDPDVSRSCNLAFRVVLLFVTFHFITSNQVTVFH